MRGLIRRLDFRVLTLGLQVKTLNPKRLRARGFGLPVAGAAKKRRIWGVRSAFRVYDPGLGVEVPKSFG